MVPLAVKLEADLQLPCPEERIPNRRNVLIKYTGTDFQLLRHPTRVFLFSIKFYFPQMTSNMTFTAEAPDTICIIPDSHRLIPVQPRSIVALSRIRGSSLGPVFRGVVGEIVTISHQYFTMNPHVSAEFTSKQQRTYGKLFISQ